MSISSKGFFLREEIGLTYDVNYFKRIEALSGRGSGCEFGNKRPPSCIVPCIEDFIEELRCLSYDISIPSRRE